MRTPDGDGIGMGERGRARLEHRSTRRRSAASRRRRPSASRNPKAIEPGLYTVVLEPQAVGRTSIPQLIGAFNARANDEGRGTFSKPGGGTKLGEKIADERVTIYSDPDRSRPARRSRSAPTACRSRRVVYIENGHPQELLVRSLLGAEAGQDSRPAAVVVGAVEAAVAAAVVAAADSSSSAARSRTTS